MGITAGTGAGTTAGTGTGTGTVPVAANPMDKPTNPIKLAKGPDIVSKPVRDPSVKAKSERDNKAIRDFKGNIIAYADTQDTSTSFTWTATP